MVYNKNERRKSINTFNIFILKKEKARVRPRFFFGKIIYTHLLRVCKTRLPKALLLISSYFLPPFSKFGKKYHASNIAHLKKFVCRILLPTQIFLKIIVKKEFLGGARI